MISNNILEVIGHTPLIRLNRMVDEDSAEILVKFEGLNVGGSIKTRTAYNMILAAERDGLINKDTIIVGVNETGDEVKKFTLEELLPYSFGAENL